MLDFGVLPPEVTSTRIYSGPGSVPIIAAATAWDGLAAQLEAFAQGYASITLSLEGDGWSGPAAAAMAAAAAPFAEWAAATAAQATQAASQARAAAAAYEAALAATVPPAVVTANRTQLQQLSATNIFGQNTPAIATTEADYSEMWAQDTGAMYGYAASSSHAAELPPFAEPPPTTNPAGLAAQEASVAEAAATAGAQDLTKVMSALPQQLENLSTGPGAVSATAAPTLKELLMLEEIGMVNTLSGPSTYALQLVRTLANGGSFLLAAQKFLSAGASAAAAAAPAVATAGAAELGAAGAGGAVLASVGEATSVGALSAPHAWAEAVPVATMAEDPLFLSDVELAAESEAEGLTPSMMGALPAAALGGALARGSVSNVLRVAPRRFKMPRHSAGG